MIPRLLSIAGPLSVYASLAVLMYGLWQERRKFDWLSLAPAFAGLAASIIFITPVHRLFFDEDIYINIASNLTHAPVNQVTVLGGPGDVQISSYYKEPAGWPVLLSLAFLVTRPSETVASWVARILFAIAIASVFHLAMEVLKDRTKALVAAVFFGATPICFWFSVSAGTDIPAALLAALGMWGLIAGNGPLAAAAFPLAAQTRMELLILVPLVWFSRRVSSKWKIAAGCMVAVEIAHVAWVMSLAPALARVEGVSTVFSLKYLASNVKSNLVYLLNPYAFFTLVTVLAIIALAGRRQSWLLSAQVFAVMCVYLVFYAGSFDLNPRYSIQILAPMTVLAASFIKGGRTLLLFLLLPAYTRLYEPSQYVAALSTDHRISSEFAAQLKPSDLVLSGQPEMFLNHGKGAMNAIFASKHKEMLEAEIGRRKVWYHSGVRANVPDTEDSLADRWVKSNFELHLIQSQEISGMRIAFYELLLKHVDREARLSSALEGKGNRGETW